MIINDSINHFCFDKDGVIIDVHEYWNYNCRLRAKCLINKLQLDPSLMEKILWAMGIEAKSGLIKQEGPVGYDPRDVVIKSTLECLKDFSREVTFSDISTIFMEVDTFQQTKDDYKIQLLEGVKNSLQWLKEKEIMISIYTSDRRLNAEKIADKVGLGDLIDIIVGGDDVEKGKPDPEGFLKACYEVNVEPDYSAYIGDTVADMVMGKRGGAAMVGGLETGLFARSQLQKETPYTYSSMTQFHAEIQQFQSRPST